MAYLRIFHVFRVATLIRLALITFTNGFVKNTFEHLLGNSIYSCILIENKNEKMSD